MKFLLYPIIDNATKRKIKALVDSGHVDFFQQYPLEFYKDHNLTMFKNAIDNYYNKIFSGKLYDAHYGHPEE